MVGVELQKFLPSHDRWCSWVSSLFFVPFGPADITAKLKGRENSSTSSKGLQNKMMLLGAVD